MFAKVWFQALTKRQISELRGGPKHNFIYFVGIAEGDVLTDIMKEKLKNQMGSQRSARFPEGYELFETFYGTPKLCLEAMTISVPRLKLRPVGWPNPTPTPRIVSERKAACVLNPGLCTEVFHILEVAAKVSEVKHRIRLHAVKSRARLDLVLSLMAHPGDIPLLPDPADRFEAYALTVRWPMIRKLPVSMPRTSLRRVS